MLALSGILTFCVGLAALVRNAGKNVCWNALTPDLIPPDSILKNRTAQIESREASYIFTITFLAVLQSPHDFRLPEIRRITFWASTTTQKPHHPDGHNHSVRTAAICSESTDTSNLTMCVDKLDRASSTSRRQNVPCAIEVCGRAQGQWLRRSVRLLGQCFCQPVL